MELKNQCIFMFGLMRFDNPVESTNYTLARHLARDNRVFYIDNPYTYKDCISKRGTPAFQRRFPHFRANSMGVIDTDIPNLKVIIPPPVLSINWLPNGRIYQAALRLSEQAIYQRIMLVKEAYEIDQFIYINSFNFYYPNLGKLLKAQLNVYHCVDPLVHAYELKHGETSEAQLTQDSDLVICTSKQLTEQKKKLNAASYLIPNAADLEHAAKALDPDLPEHPILADIPKPIVGYFGAVERRTDFWLLRQVLAHHRDKSFVLVGPVSHEFLPDWISSAPNLYLNAAVPYNEMPAVLKGFDVAIIPFKKDSASASIFPLKLFEYLGAGKPVVSTDFNADLENYTSGTVTFCSGALQFSKAIDDALATDSAELIRARVEVASTHTWHHRATEFASLIQEHLEKKINPTLSIIENTF